MAYSSADPRKLDVKELEELGHTKTPLMKVIRQKCIDCCSGEKSEVVKCHISDCVLWPYRMGGSNVFNKREMSDTQKERLANFNRKG